MNSLQDFGLLPNWIKAIYHLDPLIQRTVKDWRMTKNSKEILFERLAYQLYQENEYWKKSYEELQKSAKSSSRIILGEE